MIDFFPPEHITSSNKRRFGICDRPIADRAYIAEKQGKDWIATVDNFYQIEVGFVPIDHCVELRKADGQMDNRCDGCLFYESTIIFVELKQRREKGARWIKDGEQQLRSTIAHFERQEVAKNFSVKKAYIANSERPFFRTGQAERMDRFFSETNYILKIENRIEIE